MAGGRWYVVAMMPEVYIRGRTVCFVVICKLVGIGSETAQPREGGCSPDDRIVDWQAINPVAVVL